MRVGAWPSAAADSFVCDCAPGADPQCQAGNDAAAGTDPAAPWRTYDRAQDAFATLAAGDGIRFCRGGSFMLAGSRQFASGACRAENRCRIEDYAPPWGSGDEGAPLLTSTGSHGFAFADSPPVNHDEGYVLRGLHLRCTGCAPGDWGVFLTNDVDDVLLEALTIEGFDIGVHLTRATQPCGPRVPSRARPCGPVPPPPEPASTSR